MKRFKKFILAFAICLFLLPVTVAAAEKDCVKITNDVDFAACVSDRTKAAFSDNYAPAFCRNSTVRNGSPQLSSFCNTPGCPTFKSVQDDDSSSAITAEADGAGDESEYNKYAEYCTDLAEFTKNEAEYNNNKREKALEGVCIGLTAEANRACKSLEPTDENAELIALQGKILNGEIVAFNEEPIGNENVYNRKQICETNFVRNLAGHLQKIRPLNTDGTPKYAVEITNCRSYIVAECTPNNTNVNTSITLAEGKALPLVTYCDKVQVFTGRGGVDLLQNYIRFIYTWAAGFIGIISVFVIMLSGIQLSAAGSDSEVFNKAKQRIVQSLSALVILFLSSVILYVINPTFFVTEDIGAVQQAAEETVNNGN